MVIADIRKNDATVPRMGLWYAVMAIGSFFGVLMIPFSIHHARQISQNMTTIEFLNNSKEHPLRTSVRLTGNRGETVTEARECLNLLPAEHPFDLGFSQNWQQVMGQMKLDRWLVLRVANWLLPLQQRYVIFARRISLNIALVPGMA